MPDFFTNTLLSQPITQDVRDQAMAVIAKAERAMPWAGSLQGPAALILNQGRWPMPAGSGDVTSEPTQQTQWKAFASAYSPITKAVLRGEMAAAKAEGARLAANESFWNTTLRVTTAVATTGLSEVARLWERLQDLLTQIKNDRQATATSLSVVAKAVADPKAAPALATQRQQLEQLKVANAAIGSGTVSALGPLAPVLGSKEDLGLSGPAVLMATKAAPWMTPAKLIAAGVGAAVLISAIAGVTVWANKQAEVKAQADRLAMETLSRKDAVAEQLLRDGKITTADYKALLQQNAKDVSVVREANEGQGFGSNLGKYLGYGAVVAGIGLAIYFVMKGRRGGSASPG